MMNLSSFCVCSSWAPQSKLLQKFRQFLSSVCHLLDPSGLHQAFVTYEQSVRTSCGELRNSWNETRRGLPVTMSRTVVAILTLRFRERFDWFVEWPLFRVWITLSSVMLWNLFFLEHESLAMSRRNCRRRGMNFITSFSRSLMEGIDLTRISKSCRIWPCR